MRERQYVWVPWWLWNTFWILTLIGARGVIDVLAAMAMLLYGVLQNNVSK